MKRVRGVGALLTSGERAVLARKGSGVVPRNRAELAEWVSVVLGVEVTSGSLVEGSDSALDYLEWAFFGGSEGERGESSVANRQSEGGGRKGEEAGDCVVWASRGGGKTLYAAVATVLDLVFRAGIEVMVLGGSREQSQRMHAHLRRFFERPGLAELVDGKIGERRGRLKNGSSVEVLSQSERSVRGARPQKLRCDEVELFDEDVWSAAQLVTRSKWCGRGDRRVFVRGAVEAFSTCHRAGGLMSRLIEESKEGGSRRLFRWTAIDVLERCSEERACERCEIWDECGGRAKKRVGKGHFLIDDAITMKRRSGREAWESEMLCERPMRRRAVFPEFDPAVHVVGEGGLEAWGLEGLSSPQDHRTQSPSLIAGMDFGFRSPTVILWASVDETGVVRVLDERIESGVLLDEHVRSILGIESGKPPSPQARRPFPKWIGVDPAGCQRSDQTGLSPIAVLRRAGIVVKHRRSSIEEGLRLIRARLSPASGPPTLFIHARCVRLIECLMNYRFPDNENVAAPLKDGHDHAVDALRYMLVNLEAGGKGGVGRY